MPVPVRWGILSTALINTKVLGGAALTSEAEIVAIGSRDLHKSSDAATRWGIPRAHGSYDALLGDPDVEAVYIPLPNNLHHPWTMRALAAGKHVLCEKPYSRRPSEVDEAFDLAESRGLLLSEAFMYRYNPQIRELTRLVQEGMVGELRVITSSFSWPTDAPDDVRLDPDLDGGSLMDVGVYCVSASRLLAGEPAGVTGVQRTGSSGVDETFVGTLTFENGAIAHFDCGFHLPDRSYLEVVGTQGTLTVSDPWHCTSPGLRLVGRDGEVHELPVAQENSYRLELEEFGRAVRGLPNQLLGRSDAVGQSLTVDALYRSAALGTTITPC